MWPGHFSEARAGPAASPLRFLGVAVWCDGAGYGYSAGMMNTVEPTSHYFTSQGVKLHYLDWGNTSAPSLLLIHGTRDHARSWDWTARALRDRWHVVALDLRGHGDSEWSPDGAYLLPYHLLDILEMIELLGPEPVTVVAHSFGGNVVARYAGIYPERIGKIVFVDSLGPTPDNYRNWDSEGPVSRTRGWIEQRRDSRLMHVRRLPSIEDGAARMQKTNPRLSAEQAFHLASYGMRKHEDGYAWKFDPRVSMFAPEDFAVQGSPYWSQITAPTLILSGKKSWTSDPVADGRAAFFQNVRCVALENAGHWLHHDELDAFLALLSEFL
jgi:pimeloyl-ACP methyl ester carboxylesterase